MATRKVGIRMVRVAQIRVPPGEPDSIGAVVIILAKLCFDVRRSQT